MTLISVFGSVDGVRIYYGSTHVPERPRKEMTYVDNLEEKTLKVVFVGSFGRRKEGSVWNRNRFLPL